MSDSYNCLLELVKEIVSQRYELDDNEFAVIDINDTILSDYDIDVLYMKNIARLELINNIYQNKIKGNIRIEIVKKNIVEDPKIIYVRLQYTVPMDTSEL